MRRPRESPWVCTDWLWSDLHLGFMHVASVFGTQTFVTHSSAVNYFTHRLAHAPHPPVSSALSLTLTSARWPLPSILLVLCLVDVGDVGDVSTNSSVLPVAAAGLGCLGLSAPLAHGWHCTVLWPGFQMRTPGLVNVFCLGVTHSFHQQVLVFPWPGCPGYPASS